MSDLRRGGPRVVGGMRRAWILLPDGRSLRTLVDGFGVEPGCLWLGFLVEGKPYVFMQTVIPIAVIQGIEDGVGDEFGPSEGGPPVYSPLAAVRKRWRLDEVGE